MTLGAWLLAGVAVLVIVGGAVWLRAWFATHNNDDRKP